MSYRIVQIFTDKDPRERLDKLRDDGDILDYWEIATKKKRTFYNVLCRTDDTQLLTDKLQPMVSSEDRPHIAILPVQAVLPRVPDDEDDEDDKRLKKKFKGISREELYEQVQAGAKLDRDFLLLVLFSTIVAAIGLLEDNVAVIIGAMVIAPLLGPNLALSLGATLGDKDLIIKALKTGFSGLGLAFVLAFIIGLIWQGQTMSLEILSRTDVGLDGMVLAAVSGAAGVLSLTAGASSVLVGVMVAVALLPPVVTSGIMLSAGDFSSSFGALLLLCVNIVCVNLAAKLIFMMKGVEPRTWYKKQKAQGARKRQLVFWFGALLVLVGVIFLRKFEVELEMFFNKII